MKHHCQEDLVVIEFTGQGPSNRKESKSEALAEDFDSVLGAIHKLRYAFFTTS